MRDSGASWQIPFDSIIEERKRKQKKLSGLKEKKKKKFRQCRTVRAWARRFVSACVCGCGVCECVRVLVWVCNIIVGARAREGFSPVVLSRRPERGGPFPHSPWVPRPFRPCICRESSQFDLGLVVRERPNQSDATPKADPIGLPGRPPLSPGRPALGPGQIQRQRPAELRILQRQRIRSRRRTPTSCRRVILLL
jgi:hypothetical protein